jgi:nucleoside-diphosphate-sugar epimerase
LRIGVLGQGRLGFGLASSLHGQGHSIFSWARHSRDQVWNNQSITDFGNFNHSKLDKLVIASGSANPRSITPLEELDRTVRHLSLISKDFSGQVYFLSSGAVYGDCHSAMRESDICRPSTIYGLSKFSAEEKLIEKLGSNLTILRIGNIVPEKLDFGIFQMVKENLLSQSAIRLMGDSQDSRDYLGEKDLISIMHNLIVSNHQLDLLNIGSGESISLLEIVEILSSRYSDQLPITWAPRSEFDVSNTYLDVSSLKSLIDFPFTNPKTLIENLFASEIEAG